MDEADWLKGVVVGDTVLVKTGWGLDIDIVVAVDRSSITTRHKRFHLSTGIEISKRPKQYRQWLVNSTPEERDKVRAHRARISLIVGIEKYPLNTLTTEQLIRIHKILNEESKNE